MSEQFPISHQGSPVLSLSELSKAPLHNGLSTSPLAEGSSTRLSPPNVSALLDISLPGPPEDVLSQGEPATQISDSIIEIAISSGQYGNAPAPPSWNQFPIRIGDPGLPLTSHLSYLPNLLGMFSHSTLVLHNKHLPWPAEAVAAQVNEVWLARICG